jgi:hypothetical protein
MQKYSDTVTTRSGRAVTGATIAVYIYNTTTRPTIYADNGITPITTLTTDSNGRFEFYVADGTYDIEISGDGVTTQRTRGVVIADPVTPVSGAAISAASAAASASSAAAIYDAFDDRYLGSKTTDPTTDNDGNALLVGATYWNSTASELRYWTGSAWGVDNHSGVNFPAQLHRKRILWKLPMRTADYAGVLATYGYSYHYPQAMCVDETAKQLFIVRAPSGGANDWQWVEVYDIADEDNPVYLRTFSAGNLTSQGIAITYESGVRYVWIKNTSPNLSKYDITTLPANLSRLTAAATISVDLNFSFCIRDGVLTTETYSTPLGLNRQRYRYARRDLTGTQTGLVDVGPLMAGVSGTYQDYIPKQQSIAEGNGIYVFGMGGYHPKGSAVTPYQYNGVRVFNSSGKPLFDTMLDPEKMITLLRANGVDANRVENEGVCVRSDGRILALVCTTPSTAAQNLVEGITILEEFSRHPGAIDFSSAAVTWSPGFDIAAYDSGNMPREAGVIVDPLLRTPFTTLSQILAFMVGLELRRLTFYTADLNPTDLNGATFPASAHVEIRNVNNSTFHMYCRRTGCDQAWTITGGSSGTQTIQPRAAVFAHNNSVNQNITRNTNVKLSLSATSIDTAGMFDTSTSKYTPRAGIYRMHAQANFASGYADADTLQLYIYKNGSMLRRTIMPAKGITNNLLQLSFLEEANGTDYYELYAYAAGSGTAVVSGSSAYTFFDSEQI